MLFGRRDPMDVVERALRERGWKYQRDNPQHIITGVSVPGFTSILSIHHEEGKKTVLFLFYPSIEGTATVKIHESAGYTPLQVARACELLLGENYRIVLGCFERDPSDGEIRLRIALPYRDTDLSIQQVNWCIDIGFATLAKIMQEVERQIGIPSASHQRMRPGNVPGEV